MSFYAIDTSVIIKWFNQESEGGVEIAHTIYNDMLDSKIILTAPSLLATELANALKKGKNIPNSEIKKCISNLFSLPIILKEPTQGVLEQAVEFMEKYQLTAYDALFVATAKDGDCQLISADSKDHGRITDGSVIMLENYHTKK